MGWLASGWVARRLAVESACRPHVAPRFLPLPRLGSRTPQLALGWDEESQLLASFGSEAAAAAEAASGGGRAAARTGWRGPFWLHALAQVAATALALPVCVGLCVLLGWNAYLALQNKTTIEYHEGEGVPGVGAARAGRVLIC